MTDYDSRIFLTYRREAGYHFVTVDIPKHHAYCSFGSLCDYYFVSLPPFCRVDESIAWTNIYSRRSVASITPLGFLYHFMLPLFVGLASDRYLYIVDKVSRQLPLSSFCDFILCHPPFSSGWKIGNTEEVVRRRADCMMVLCLNGVDGFSPSPWGVDSYVIDLTPFVVVEESRLLIRFFG